VLTVLICEDLARLDPVNDLVRAVGPNLVMSLLMDGPQLTTRWPARYATVLADDSRIRSSHSDKPWDGPAQPTSWEEALARYRPL